MTNKKYSIRKTSVGILSVAVGLLTIGTSNGTVSAEEKTDMNVESVKNNTEISVEDQIKDAEKDFMLTEQQIIETDKNIESTKSQIELIENSDAKSAKELIDSKAQLEAQKKEVDAKLAEAKNHTPEGTAEVEKTAKDIKTVEDEVKALETQKDTLNTEKVSIEKQISAEKPKKVNVLDENPGFTISQEYINTLKEYSKLDLTQNSQKQKTLENKLAQLDAQESLKHQYKSSDTSTEQVDINNLTKAQKEEINRFALSLVNAVRSQFGAPKATLNKDTMAMANDIARAYVSKDWSWKDVAAYGHYHQGVNEVASKYGLRSAGNVRQQYYENMNTWALTSKTMTMAEIKELIVDGFVSFFHNGKEWLHAMSISGVGVATFTDPSNNFGFALSSRSDVTGFHVIAIPTTEYNGKNYYVVDATKFDINNTVDLTTSQSSVDNTKIKSLTKELESKVADIKALDEKLNLLTQQLMSLKSWAKDQQDKIQKEADDNLQLINSLTQESEKLADQIKQLDNLISSSTDKSQLLEKQKLVLKTLGEEKDKLISAKENLSHKIKDLKNQQAVLEANKPKTQPKPQDDKKDLDLETTEDENFLKEFGENGKAFEGAKKDKMKINPQTKSSMEPKELKAPGTTLLKAKNNKELPKTNEASSLIMGIGGLISALSSFGLALKSKKK